MPLSDDPQYQKMNDELDAYYQAIQALKSQDPSFNSDSYPLLNQDYQSKYIGSQRVVDPNANAKRFHEGPDDFEGPSEDQGSQQPEAKPNSALPSSDSDAIDYNYDANPNMPNPLTHPISKYDVYPFTPGALSAAQGAANDSHFGNGTLRSIADAVGIMTKTPVDSQMWNELSKQSDMPLQNLKGQQGQVIGSMEIDQMIDAHNPDSDYSKAMRQAVKDFFPGQFDGAELSNMSASDMTSMVKTFDPIVAAKLRSDALAAIAGAKITSSEGIADNRNKTVKDVAQMNMPLKQARLGIAQDSLDLRGNNAIEGDIKTLQNNLSAASKNRNTPFGRAAMSYQTADKVLNTFQGMKNPPVELIYEMARDVDSMLAMNPTIQGSEHFLPPPNAVDNINSFKKWFTGSPYASNKQGYVDLYMTMAKRIKDISGKQVDAGQAAFHDTNSRAYQKVPTRYEDVFNRFKNQLQVGKYSVGGGSDNSGGKVKVREKSSGTIKLLPSDQANDVINQAPDKYEMIQ